MNILLVGSVSVANLNELLITTLVDWCIVEQLYDDLANITTLEAVTSVSKYSW